MQSDFSIRGRGGQLGSAISKYLSATDDKIAEGTQLIWASGTNNSQETSSNCSNELLEFIKYFENRRTPLAKVYFLSSGGAIYGTSKELSFLETSMTNPQTPYAKLKMRQEEFLFDFCSGKEIQLCIFRLSNVFSTSKKSVVTAMLESLKKDLPFQFYVDPTSRKQYGFADDYAKFITLLIQGKLVNYNFENIIINVFSPFVYSILEIKNLVENALDRKVKVELSQNLLPDETVILDTIWNWADPNLIEWKTLEASILDMVNLPTNRNEI